MRSLCGPEGRLGAQEERCEGLRGLHTLGSASGRKHYVSSLRKVSQEFRKKYYNSPVKKCNSQHSRFEGIRMGEREAGAGRANAELELEVKVSRNRDGSS